MTLPKTTVLFALLLTALIGFSAVDLFAADPEYTLMELANVSRYNEDRIAFQHVELANNGTGVPHENSQECLLIIKNRKMYLIKDGYDDPALVAEQRLINNMERALFEENELWTNRINGKPDYIQITDRRVELMKKIDDESKNENFIDTTFGGFFKSVRDSYVQRHVQIFRELMRNRGESQLNVERKPIPKNLILNSDSEETKFSISASAKTMDGKLYYCEDADGDGITETFMVSIADGFNWGYKSGPNLIFIYRNSGDALKEVIGKLAQEAYYGTPEEQESIKKTFPSEERLQEMIDDLFPLQESSK